jgi:hypothetical protein
MRKLINLILRIVVIYTGYLLLITNSLYADELPSVQYDSSSLVVRNFDQQTIQQYKTDPDFDYILNQENNLANSNYELNWINRFLKKLLGISFNKDTAKLWEIIIYIICGGILLFTVLNLVKADKKWFIHRNTKKAKIIHEELESNIHDMDMDELIRQAIEQKQYRRAVRLLYLKSLKELNNNNLIEWSSQKTNSDYLNELKAGSLKESFKSNTLIFEYIWYGDFQVDEQLLQKVKISFDTFISDIKSR